MLITIKGKIRGMGIGEIPKIGCWSVSRTRLMYTPAPVNGQPNHFSSHSNNNFPNHHSSHLEKAQRSNANGEAIHLLWLILCQWEGGRFLPFDSLDLIRHIFFYLPCNVCLFVPASPIRTNLYYHWLIWLDPSDNLRDTSTQAASASKYAMITT